MLTVKEFAKIKNISVNVVNTWIYRHGLPIIKIGKRNYIDETDYDNWKNQHKQVMSSKQSIEIPEPVIKPKSRVAAKMRKIY